MNNTPRFPILHISQSLLKFMFIESVMSSNLTSSISPFSFCPQSFPASGYFPMSWLFPPGGQSIRTSASPAVLPMNIQGWFPLGLTGLISLQSKGLSRVSSTPQFKSLNSSAFLLLYGPDLTSVHDYWKNYIDYMDLCQQSGFIFSGEPWIIQWIDKSRVSSHLKHAQ